MEGELGVALPRAFVAVLGFFNGSGIAVLPLHAIASNPATNVISETLRLRVQIGLPQQFVVLGEPPESILLLDCEEGGVVWCDAIDAPRLGKEPLRVTPKRWVDFFAFVAHLLDEEEADR
jgi:hypothetical protein